MLKQKKPAAPKPIFSAEKINELNKLMRDKVNEIIALQDIGEIPCASIMQRCHVKRRDVMDIFGYEEAQAGRIMALARKKANKKRGQYISVKEFAAATKLDEHSIQRALDMCPLSAYRKKPK